MIFSLHLGRKHFLQSAIRSNGFQPFPLLSGAGGTYARYDFSVTKLFLRTHTTRNPCSGVAMKF